MSRLVDPRTYELLLERNKPRSLDVPDFLRVLENRPRIVFFCLAAKECKRDAKGGPSRINADHIEKRHAVLVRLVRAVKEEEVGVRSKIAIKRVGMREEDGCNPAMRGPCLRGDRDTIAALNLSTAS
ncbi:hypothetical protein CHGG_10123 [Chaetomium globosum CBS 148.51]|uniref:Uncharacterized protein n=1 Tax=Chaetomium globosum (strain ATCC 6205 / CBS 148.51 / DSM 1962 / NBRC 6347 / NRRL 1970) TaxID=306901 RepID=Q2GPI1_CHAGB|nr:uncharacterized protein CHGG_10123 [Chaetomium globosum CBS 148.51]EAQ83719.1 hypothetical protein CHGG_10123 [Chaetomium globosum CBS 148.51]